MGKKEQKISPMPSKNQTRKDRYNQMVYENWPANRALGKRKFVFKFGALSWGLGTYVIYWIMMMILNLITKSNAAFNLYQFIFTLLLFIVVGSIYGIILWHRNEKIFKTKYPYGRKAQSK
ncbi:YrzE family protein [Fusibacter ferrireducens]|uniref:DUF2628 domain-containing protein n=1 Tax=Fusibacter ferrireducens TaxID=2785058 RepID=A0ABR9ZN15_9FIRM|nr:YrzE family protein [Fusibacter ferrireducens]MBF4691847.1 hypothetical protein [Fusibacter ferrireducens]